MAAALRTSWDQLAPRLSDALPALIVFGPLAALASLFAATLADLRG